MKKEYITPEMLVHKVLLERFMGESDDQNPVINEPIGDWDDQGAKKGGDSWTNPSDDIWED